MSSILKNRVMMILSLWCYPFGGGEEYLYQTAIWASNVGMKCYWLSFSNAKNINHPRLAIHDHKSFISIDIPGGFNANVLVNWLRLINPDVVHHQGHMRRDFYDCCEKIRSEFVTGIHFWSGIINLDPQYGNIEILKHAENHLTDPDFEYLRGSQYAIFYSVSDFVTDCIQKICDYKVNFFAYPASLKLKNQVENINIDTNKYVTMINIHKLKGGEILLRCLQELPDIPFIAVRTEYHSEDLDKKIYYQIIENNKQNKIPSLYFERLDNIKYIYSKTKIFLATSIVDETFCRTANEAMMNGLCILTSGRGNLGYMINDARYVIDPNDTALWVKKIKELYYNTDLIKQANEYSLTRYEKYSEEISKDAFLNIITYSIKKGKNNNIMIYCPWCDQGLGIQSRNYYNILKLFKYNVCLFSYKPYNSNTSLDLQKNPEEWLVDNVYYSTNDRESVTDKEISCFVSKYNIGICIIPETCWFRVFEIAKLLKSLDVKSFAIPNIEIVRKDEIYKHTYFSKILCNNKLCENIFNNHNIKNTSYIGYGICDNSIELITKKIDTMSTIRFLFIGGMNAFSRKHILEICEAFEIANKKVPNISLTCTIQKTNNLEIDDKEKLEKFFSNKNINFIQNHMSYNDIIKLYYNHEISIQVSKHEGLGLGFYEALSTATPIITLNTPPHNEIVQDGINGWIIPCYYKDMTDNNNGLIQSAYFEPQILAQKIIDIVTNRNELSNIFQKIVNNYIEQYAPQHFFKKFTDALY